MIKFVPRLTVFGKGDPNYYGTKNAMVKYGYLLPNCTTYVHGRWLELTGSDSGLSLGNANTYMDRTTSYQKGTTPKLGAIAVWDGGSSKLGHVATVERINADGTVTYSESNYGGSLFNVRTLKNEFLVNNTFKFLGYIYANIEFVNEIPEVKPEVIEPISINVGDSVIVNGYGTAGSDGTGKTTRILNNEKAVVLRTNGLPARPYGLAFIEDSIKNKWVDGWFSSKDIKKA